MMRDNLLPHMSDVVRCESSLRELNLVWRVIEMNARMNCSADSHRLLPMMAATRSRFESLQSDLISSLVDQKIAGVSDGLRTKAQNIIDVIVRNLFERTADVGFLATDRALCEFVADPGTSRSDTIARLREYRDKYTVYDEILLLDLKGQVLANVAENMPQGTVDEAWIEQVMQSDRYVETFRLTTLRPGFRPSLIYSHRMLHPRTGQPVGMLCLVFGFDGEMADIFSAHTAQDDRTIRLLLDGDSRVISSSDESWIALGSKLPVQRPQESLVCSVGGCQYISQTAHSAGYEGYPGPAGWQGRVMVPVALAFTEQQLSRPRLEDSMAQGLLAHADRFCPPLLEIVDAARRIRRVVWNGQVMTAGDATAGVSHKAVLEQITEAGARSDEVFKHSIQNLFDAALDLKCASAESVTQLLVELLDRNLYERSNDCRWWAMTPELRALLADSNPESVDVDAVTAILYRINSLYTVYARLAVYDRDGRIVSATNPQLADGTSVIGMSIDGDALRAVRALQSSQHYHATQFGPSRLYDGRATYVYHAAIRAPGNERDIVGGIGIVFDAEPQFAAMLRSGLAGAPVDSVALFTDRSGRVISSTAAAHPAGSLVSVPAQLLGIGGGESASRVLNGDGEYVFVAGAASHGYREFKKTDGYRDEVLAVLLQPLGPVVETSHRHIAQIFDGAGASARGFATFLTEMGLFALPVGCTVEALPGKDIRPVALGAGKFRVGAIARRRAEAIQGYVWVYDMNALLGGSARADGEHGEVIVLRHDEVELGFVVDNLHAVSAFEDHEIVPATPYRGARNTAVSHYIRANGGELLIQVLDPRPLVESVLLGTEEEFSVLEELSAPAMSDSAGGSAQRLQG